MRSATLDQEERQNAFLSRFLFVLRLSVAGDKAEEKHKDDGAGGGNENCRDHSIVGTQAEMTSNEAAHQRAGYADNNVHEEPVAAAFHDLAGCPAGDESDNDPPKYRHMHDILLFELKRFRSGDGVVRATEEPSEAIRRVAQAGCLLEWVYIILASALAI
jgi:hypothetical protein